MKKRTFILFLGIGWCGTTSLFKTLQFRYPYMHGGFIKESDYLSKVYSKEIKDSLPIDSQSLYLSNNFHNNYHQLFLTSLNALNANIDIIKPDTNDDTGEYHKNMKKVHAALSKFSEKDANYYYMKNYSLEKYVNFYERLSDYCGDDFKFVGDFSNNNELLPQKELSEVLYSLSKSFDVKVLLMLRDPIRRAFSNAGFLKSDYGKNLSERDDKITFHEFFDMCNTYYTSTIKKAYNVFGKENVCYLIMEDLFKESERTEVCKLEKYLNIKISSMHPCCFVPDLGINAPRIPGLKDQWSSDIAVLTEEFYLKNRNSEKYIKIYDAFEELHGFLPADWGRPIDYGYMLN
jgi:hypothetical protein